MTGRRLSITERDRIIQRAVDALPEPLAADILNALMLPDGQRAILIGRLYAHPQTRRTAEVLMDLEADRQLGLDFAQALKDRAARSER